MKKTLLSLAFMGLIGITYAQKKGVKFEQGSSWEQIVAKAKAENKYIFMDVFATWCGPCKEMDVDVYPSEKLGELMNDKFISIKVQVDTSKNDDEQIKNWYKSAHEIIVKNNVIGLPTFLFFSPDGRLVDRAIGYNDVEALTKLACNALNPQKQYYTLLDNYKNGSKDYNSLPELIIKAKSLKQDSLVEIMINDYLGNYLYKLPEKDLFTKENLLFVTSKIGELFTSDSKIFQFIYKYPSKADDIVGNRSFAQFVISWRITKEELYNKLWKKNDEPFTKTPDWGNIISSIQKKYGKRYADSLVTPAQFLFYEIDRNWIQYVKLTEAVVKRYPPKRDGKNLSIAIGGEALKGPGNDAWGLNGIAWTLFQNTIDPSLLKKALSWSDLSIKLEDPISDDAHQNYDTKANLLYKLGRVKEAIECEKLGIEVLKKSKQQLSFKEHYTKQYTEVISKMKKGESTWKVISK